jgi:hypothetical protein
MEIIGSFCEQGKPKISTWSYRHLNITFSIVCLWMSPPRNRRMHGQTCARGSDLAGASSESEACRRLHLGSKCRTAAKGETRGYGRAVRHVFDSRPRGRSGSAVDGLAARRFVPGARFRQWSARHPSTSISNMSMVIVNRRGTDRGWIAGIETEDIGRGTSA